VRCPWLRAMVRPAFELAWIMPYCDIKDWVLINVTVGCSIHRTQYRARRVDLGIDGTHIRPTHRSVRFRSPRGPAPSADPRSRSPRTHPTRHARRTASTAATRVTTDRTRLSVSAMSSLYYDRDRDVPAHTTKQNEYEMTHGGVARLNTHVSGGRTDRRYSATSLQSHGS
jgi:hypothetical protein